MKTLEDYFRYSEYKGAIDHSVRAEVGIDGVVRFYIHPARISGPTMNFDVHGNVLETAVVDGDYVLAV